MKTATVAEAKARLSELIGDVAHAGHSVVITKRGRPVAKLVPVDASVRLHPAKVKGWLDDDDPFFESLDDIIAERVEHRPRRVEF
jgi:prevent-host-death family protein